MKYDFDTLPDRRGTDAVKWRIADGELPMWVADMDFAVAPEIAAAIRKRAAHPIYGYTVLPSGWADAVIGWTRTRYGYAPEKEWLQFCTGIVPAIASMLRRLTAPGDGILIQTPVYNAFLSTITGNGRHIVENPLHYENGEYSIDFADLEKKLARPDVMMMLICNPHNPIGKLWNAQELGRIADLCRENHVIPVCDEIHCDLTDPGVTYTPYLTVSDVCREDGIVCIAPTKTFNLAGLHTSCLIIPNRGLRDRVRAGLSADGQTGVNAFAGAATVAAYEEGGPWLDELRQYLFDNKQRVREFLRAELPEISMPTAQATYLLWLDCSALPGDKSDLAGFIRRETGLFLNSGVSYGESGRDFMRLNIASPRAMLEDGLSRLKKGIEAFKAANR